MTKTKKIVTRFTFWWSIITMLSTVEFGYFVFEAIRQCEWEAASCCAAFAVVFLANAVYYFTCSFKAKTDNNRRKEN